MHDEKIVSLYNAIGEAVRDDDLAVHDFRHVKNVIDIAKRVSKMLGLDEAELKDIELAALLHDVGMATGDYMNQRENHAQRSYEFAKDYTNNAEILEAIRLHSHGADSRYGRILTFADKLDVTGDRLLPGGLATVGLRQYTHIQKIDFNIKDKTLTVQFTTDGNFDKAEANSFYFTPKIHSAIKNLALKFDLSYQILVDGQAWVL